ncbi:hypothetical protein FH972_004191 [Carpinus fangiana]|uniref:Uncharacterized protein n=1 Tax=Carpinus fangiana TaxID=176857 RepID=A0A5N6QN32_9ROSI|nr:hypothetical protein FH972_004191 [Carpinus fangiana]
MTKSKSKTTSRSHTPLRIEQYLNCHPQYFQGQLSVSSQLQLHSSFRHHPIGNHSQNIFQFPMYCDEQTQPPASQFPKEPAITIDRMPETQFHKSASLGTYNS